MASRTLCGITKLVDLSRSGQRFCGGSGGVAVVNFRKPRSADVNYGHRRIGDRGGDIASGTNVTVKGRVAF